MPEVASKANTCRVGRFTLTQDRPYEIAYRCDTPGPEVEEGTVIGKWTGAVDVWGKLTIEPSDGSPAVFLLPREFVSVKADVTDVVYRVFKNGEAIAIFPGIPGTNSPYTCQSYMHMGQHGSCDLGVINSTRYAKPEEYADLHRELTGRGYNLRVIRRIGSHYLEIRRKALAEMK